MKRLLTLTLALLMTVALLGAVGTRTYALAEGETPYVGLWEITGREEGGVYTSYAEGEDKLYLDFLANGAIYGVMVSGENASDDYLGYKVTGENTLDMYEGEDPLPAVYDPATGIITVTEPNSGLKTFIERVKADPLPDIRALVDHSQQEMTYYGYAMTQGDQTLSMLEIVPMMGLDIEDFYLTLNPDGTGYLQFGQEESGGDITWNETEFTAEEDSVPYTRVGDHIVIDMGENNGSIEFAPAGEVEALMVVLDISGEASAEVDADPEDLVGEWKLLKAVAAGQTLTAEQIKEQGLEMSFRFNADGSASMTSNGNTTDGLSWALDGSKLSLSVSGYDIFDLSYDGEYLILSMMAKLYFEKIG